MTYADDIFNVLGAQRSALDSLVAGQIKSATDPLSAQIVDLTSRLNSADTRATDLTSQLNAAKTQSADLTSQLDAANARIAELEAALEEQTTVSEEPVEEPINEAPSAVIIASNNNLNVAVYGASSVDYDGTIVSYSWNWGDGTPDSTGITATHVYTTAGIKTITLTVTDDDGATGTATQAITVTSPQPPAPVMPDATTTGVGIEGRTRTLRPYTGDYIVSTSNQVIENIDISGRFIVRAGVVNTTLRNAKVRGVGPYTKEVTLVDVGDGDKTLLDGVEVFCSSGWKAVNGIGTKNYIARRCNIHNVTDGFRLHMGDSGPDNAIAAEYDSNYVHDLIVATPDIYTRTDKKTHSDCIEIEGCYGMRMYNNNFSAYHSTDGSSNVTRTTSTYPFTPVSSGGIEYKVANSAIMLAGDTWPIQGLVIENNWFGGGEVTINHRDLGTGVIRNNKFDRGALQKVAIYPKTSTKLTISGNTYTDGTPV